MLKTIKTTKHMRLDELIKYVFDNDVTNKYFYSEQKKSLYVDFYGKIVPRAHFNKNSRFSVEVEEEITKDTVFDELVERYTVTFQSVIVKAINHKNSSIHDVLSKNEDTGCETLQIYTLIDNKLELIWESENQ